MSLRTVEMALATPGLDAQGRPTRIPLTARQATPKFDEDFGAEHMLVNMFIGDPPGNYDRILDFSTAVTGNLFFAPSADFLDDLPDRPERPAPATPSSPSTPASAPAADGSLGIGGLKRSSQQ